MIASPAPNQLLTATNFGELEVRFPKVKKASEVDILKLLHTRSNLWCQH